MRTDQFGHIRALHNLERHVDLGGGDLLILNLGLGERGLLDGRPHHRLGTAIELAAFGKLHQLGNDRRLRLEIHRQIGVVPIAQDAEPLQLLALGIDPFLRIGPAFGAEFVGRHLVLVQLFLAIFLLDLPFDRQAVAIPAGHIGRVAAEQILRAAHHVLQNVVQRMADMHVAIGIGRAIVEDELFAAPAALAQPFIQPGRLPFGENRRFLLRQAGFHRKVGFRQEHGVAPVALAVGGVAHRFTRLEFRAPPHNPCPSAR